MSNPKWTLRGGGVENFLADQDFGIPFSYTMATGSLLTSFMLAVYALTFTFALAPALILRPDEKCGGGRCNCAAPDVGLAV